MVSRLLLTVRDLTKHFPLKGGFLGRSRGVVQAVDRVSFDVHEGETLGIVGESGCGKSTTARLLVRLIEPDTGEVTFDGATVGRRIGVRELRRQVQMVFQDSYSSLNPRLSAAASIAYGPFVHGMARGPARERAHELLQAVGLDPGLFAGAIPTSCRAASASASTSRGPWPSSRGWSSSTRRCRHWTSRSAPRCSTCSGS